MSRSLPTAFIASFAADVKHAYQGKKKLRETVRNKTGVTGSTHRFNKMGKGLANRRVQQTDVIPMNIAHTNETVTLQDWHACEFTDVFDDTKTNISERSELAYTIASAIGRREDQMIIDALEATATSLSVGTDIGGVGSNLNADKIRKAAALLGQNNVDMEDGQCTFVGSYLGREALLADTEVTSADFNSVRALVNGEINTWLGFSFKWIGERDEGGLDLTGAVRTNFAYDMAAVGHAVGMDQRMEINYIPTKTSWLPNMMYSANAIEIDAGGVVEVSATES